MPLTKDGGLYSGYKERNMTNEEIVNEVRMVEEQNRLTEQMKQKVPELDKERNRLLLVDFVQKAIDNNRIIKSDRIFNYISEYVGDAKYD